MVIAAVDGDEERVEVEDPICDPSMPSPDLVEVVTSPILKQFAEEVGCVEMYLVVCWLYDVLAEVVDGLVTQPCSLS